MDFTGGRGGSRRDLATVVHKITFEVLFSQNTPDFPTADWLINPAGLAALELVPKRYWKLTVSGDDLDEMDAAEKTAIDTGPLLDVAREDSKNTLLDSAASYLDTNYPTPIRGHLVDLFTQAVSNPDRQGHVMSYLDWVASVFTEVSERGDTVDTAPDVPAALSVSGNFSGFDASNPDVTIYTTMDESSVPELLLDGLVSYVDAESGLTDSGDGTVITQAVGVATCVEGAPGEGPIRRDLGWGEIPGSTVWPGVSKAIQFAGGDWLVTDDPAVLSVFGPTTSDFTVVTMTWAFSSNSNCFMWGIGNTSNNRSLTGSLPSGAGNAYVQTIGAGIGGTGAVSTAGVPNLYTRNKFPSLIIWRQTGTLHEIFVNDVLNPVLATTFEWTIDPTHTRFCWGGTPDVSPNTGMANAMVNFLGLYSRSLTASELLQMGSFCGMRANQAIGGWPIDKVIPRVFS